MSDREAGRAAAERLALSWPDRSWVRDVERVEWARGAIDRFGELLREQPAIFKASRVGSERGAESLSPRPFQGILESLQNADDVGATELRVAVLRGAQNVLLVSHDGGAIDIGHAGAMLLPWLTTKEDEAGASGRFGIGQQTLRSLGGPLEIHCAPYHFRLTDDGPEWTDPARDVPQVYSTVARDTLVRVPLRPDVDVDGLVQFVANLGGDTLLFLRKVRRLVVIDPDGPIPMVEHVLLTDGHEQVSLRFGDAPITVEWTRLREEPTGRTYDRYLADIPVAAVEQRRHKAIGGSTTIGIAIPRQPDIGKFYDRLPLPVRSGFPFSINAQFDPDAARTTILEVPWNSRRLEDIGELLAAAAVDSFRRDPASAWRGVPLDSEVDESSGNWLVGRLRSCVVERTQAALRTNLRVTTEHGDRPLNELTFEVEDLDGLLTSRDQELLHLGRYAVPTKVRDSEGRWRDVLRDLGRSDEVSIEDALGLFDLDDPLLGVRAPDWFVSLGSAAIGANLTEDFLSRRGILLADLRRVEPPGIDTPRTLVTKAAQGGLGTALSIAMQVHPVYLEKSPESRRVEAELRRAGVLLDEVDTPRVAFSILSRLRDDASQPLRLYDGPFIALRDAFETLDDDRQRDVGPKIGANIELRGWWFDDRGTRVAGWVRPVDAYLPAAINRDKGSFAQAAAKTISLKWIDSSYARVLKRAGGRKEQGAQKFLVRLGAATQPRLVRPANEASRYQSDRPASLVADVERPTIQTREIRALRPVRTHLLDDHWSPDIDAVLADIAADRVTKRRRVRGLVLLGVLARAWDRHYADHQSAEAVYGSYGWQEPRAVVATWLARAASAAWLPSALGTVRPPSELSLPTDANQLAYGADRSRFLAAIDDSILRSPIVQALRIRRGPAASNLVGRLQELARAQITTAVADETIGIYHYLALSIPREGLAQPVDDMTAAEFRAAFSGSAGERGLLLAGNDWLGPSDVLSGPHIFGSRRSFVPYSAVLRPLWRFLGVREPTASDCISVLRDLATGPLVPHDVGVALETMRALANLLPTMTPQSRARLRLLPLWTSAGWLRRRPVYAIADPALATSVAGQVPIWDHGFTSFAGLEDLNRALGVTVIRREDFAPTVPNAYHKLTGDQIRQRFSVAVDHLRDELARGDQLLYDSIRVLWSDLGRAEVFVDPDLALRWSAGETIVEIAADAFVSRGPVTLILRSASFVGSADTAGAAIASVFDGDRQKVAWAWVSMWQRADAGELPSGVVLSEQGLGAEEDGTARLHRLKGQATGRRGRPSDGTKPSIRQSPPGPPVVVRVLKDISELEPDDGQVVNEGLRRPGVIFPAVSTVTRPEPTKSGRTGASGGVPPQDVQSKSVRRRMLPPVDEREQLAFDAVQSALALDRPEISDLRARRGVGADAMDELRQLYEIKMSSGDMLNEITLTRAEAVAAQDPDFFLALVSGLEDSAVPLSVRFIFDPLRRLSQRITGDVTLSGLREVEALEYKFRKLAGPKS